MTFEPQSLRDLAAFVVSRGIVNLGTIGDAKHKAKGFSYHLGADDLKPGASSATHPRDAAGLSNAASAIDIGKVDKTITGLRELSSWLVAECLAGAPDTHDIREIIFSRDGVRVDRWDGRDGPPGVLRLGPGQGDDSHLTHTHISYFRDSEGRDKTALLRRYFEEGSVRVTAIKGEDWLPNDDGAGGSNGVLRSVPDRGASIVIRLPLGTIVRSIAEVSARGLAWRLTERDGQALYMLRTDWTPLVPGGDPAVDAALDAYIARTNG